MSLDRIKVCGALAALAALAATSSTALAQAPAANMSFFVTSKNPGKGCYRGGLKGADA
jgi:hypothetical protein